MVNWYVLIWMNINATDMKSRIQKRKKTPVEIIDEKFIGELHKLIPGHMGLQMVIFTLVKKYYEPKIYDLPEIKAARLELAKLVHQHYSNDEGKPTMEELMKKASDIVAMV